MEEVAKEEEEEDAAMTGEALQVAGGSRERVVVL